jgi:hypothetical protein
VGSTRDFETQEQVDAMDAVRLACLSNLVLTAHQQVRGFE